MKKKKKDLNWLAKRITELEGKKVEVNIAQVKEVLRIVCDTCEKSPKEMIGLLFRVNE